MIRTKQSFQSRIALTFYVWSYCVCYSLHIWKGFSWCFDFIWTKCNIILVLSLKSLRNSWFGRKFWPIHDIFTTFTKCSSGVGIPILVEWRGCVWIWQEISYIKSRSIANSWRHLKWCFQKFEEKKRKRNVNVHCTLTCDVHSPPLVHVRVVMGGRGGLVPIFIGGPFKSLI